jgi:hypothetical protein
MEKGKTVGGSFSSSSPSFTMDLFGPKDSPKSSNSSSSTGHFGSVFGPSSTGIGKDSYKSAIMGNSGTQYGGNAEPGNSDYMNQKNMGEIYGKTNKEKNSNNQNEAADPCYFNSSIYYGGQQVYSPTAHTTNSHHMFKKDGGEEDDDPNGNNSASRGNWWQGSLYY